MQTRGSVVGASSGLRALKTLSCCVETFNDKFNVEWHCPRQSLPVRLANLQKEVDAPEMLERRCYLGQHPRIFTCAMRRRCRLLQLCRASGAMRPHAVCDIDKAKY